MSKKTTFALGSQEPAFAGQPGSPELAPGAITSPAEAQGVASAVQTPPKARGAIVADPELAVMNTISKALMRLDAAAQSRAVAWLVSKYVSDQMAATSKDFSKKPLIEP